MFKKQTLQNRFMFESDQKGKIVPEPKDLKSLAEQYQLDLIKLYLQIACLVKDSLSTFYRTELLSANKKAYLG